MEKKRCECQFDIVECGGELERAGLKYVCERCGNSCREPESDRCTFTFCSRTHVDHRL